MINNVPFPLQTITSSDQSTCGSEIVLLTDGEDDQISSCFEEVKHSGAVIHTIALGPDAARELETLSDMTGTTSEQSLDRKCSVVFLLNMIFLHKLKTAQKFPCLKVNHCFLLLGFFSPPLRSSVDQGLMALVCCHSLFFA